MSIFTPRIVAICIACSLLSLSGPVWGQADGDASATAQQDAAEGQVTDVITVTARQEEERLQDVPASVSVLTDSQIEAAGVQIAEDFIKLVPGVTMVNAAEVGDTQVNIRGINGSRDAENSFAFIVDGILMTNPAAFNRDFSNVSQIEVMKGPQGALYGRNAAAGAMIVTTRAPGDEFEGSLTVSGAEQSSYFGLLTIGGPLGDSGNARYQVHGQWRSSDGWWTNSFLNDDVVDDIEDWNLMGRLLLGNSDETEWDFKLRYGEVEAAAITFNATFALPLFAEVLGVPEFFEDSNDHNFIFQPNIDPLNNQESLEISGKVEHKLSWGQLTAWMLYSDIENAFYADGTSGAFGFFNAEPNCRQSTAAVFNSGVTLPAPQILGPVPEFSIFGPYTPTTCDGTQYQVRNQEDLSLEIRLSGEAGDRLRWQGGFYFLDIDREVGVNLGIDEGRGVTQSLFVPQGSNNPTEQLVHDQFETQVSALFGSLRWAASDSVELSLALRYDREDREVTNRVPTEPRTQYVDFTLDGMFNGGAPLNPGLDPTINPSGVIEPKSEVFEELQPKVSASWDASQSFTLYGSWGVGFKSGGFNNQGSQATVEIFYNQPLGLDLLIEDQFDKETSDAYELGFKVDVNHNLYLEGAVYQVDVTDMQFFEFLVGPFGLLRVVSNIDDVELRGWEIGGTWRIGNHLTIYGGYNKIDSEIIKNSSRPDTVGNKSPYTPDYTGDLALDYSHPLGNRWNFTTSVYYSVVGRTWFHTVQRNTRTTLFDLGFPGLGTADYSKTQRDTYGLLDLRVGIATADWSITLFGRNLTDESYLEENITAPEFGGSFVHPGTLKRIGVELGYRF